MTPGLAQLAGLQLEALFDLVTSLVAVGADRWGEGGRSCCTLRLRGAGGLDGVYPLVLGDHRAVVPEDLEVGLSANRCTGNGLEVVVGHFSLVHDLGCFTVSHTVL